MRLTTFQMFALLVAGCTHHNPSDETCNNGMYDPDEQCEPSLDGPDCLECFWLTPNHCGNGVIEVDEQCDDGNRIDGDTCSSTCRFNGIGACGDGVLGPLEQCDDGNATSGDGCSSTCEIEHAGCPMLTPPITCGTPVMASTGDPGATTMISTYSCTSMTFPGREMIYELRPAQTTQVRVVYDGGGAAFVVEDDGTQCPPHTCRADSMTPPTDFTALAGHRYLIIADSTSLVGQQFFLNLVCVGT